MVLHNYYVEVQKDHKEKIKKEKENHIANTYLYLLSVL